MVTEELEKSCNGMGSPHFLLAAALEKNGTIDVHRQGTSMIKGTRLHGSQFGCTLR